MALDHRAVDRQGGLTDDDAQALVTSEVRQERFLCLVLPSGWPLDRQHAPIIPLRWLLHPLIGLDRPHQERQIPVRVGGGSEMLA